MDFAGILAEIEKYKCNLIEITGGEPLLQQEVLPFMTRLCDLDYEVLLETAGHMDISTVDPRVQRIVDIKCPSSGESKKVRYENLHELNARDQIKFVIGNREDYHFARNILQEHKLTDVCTVLFSPVFGIDLQDMATWILQDHLPVRMQLQMHKYIWSPDTRGV